MRSTLTTYASQVTVSPVGGWYAEEAVHNHEIEHAIQYRTQMLNVFSNFKNTFSTSTELSIPLSEAATAAEAKAAITAKGAYFSHISGFATDTNHTAAIYSHNPIATFVAAQNAGIAGYVAAIDQRKIALNCL
jgi:hypothetical protein